MKTYYVKALTLEGTIKHFITKGSLYTKKGTFNCISVVAICKCASLRYAHYEDAWRGQPGVLHGDKGCSNYDLIMTGDETTDITNIWNTAKQILNDREVKNNCEKYNI